MTLRLALLGDSIAVGRGARRLEDRPAARLTRGLEADGRTVLPRVLAVPGARSAGLRAQVDRALAWAPHLAVVVIGANDLTHRVPADLAARDLGDAVRRLHDGGAQVVVAPAPDLSVLPGVPTAARPAVRAAGDRLRSAQVAAVLAAGGHVAARAHVTSAEFGADARLFSEDGFHPSAAGYRVITEALLPEVLALARELPRTDGGQSCW